MLESLAASLGETVHLVVLEGTGRAVETIEAELHDRAAALEGLI